jgi:hypothetical protein
MVDRRAVDGGVGRSHQESVPAPAPAGFLTGVHPYKTAGWTTAGSVNFIVDNLIAEKKAVPDNRRDAVRACHAVWRWTRRRKRARRQ